MSFIAFLSGVPLCLRRKCEFPAKGARDEGNRQDTLEEIGHYARLHKITFPLLKDAGNKIADEFGARRITEAFVLDRGGAVRYAGTWLAEAEHRTA
ncbi:MAG: hypothetical protein WD738_00310 [Pirellulales bacterium]